MAGLRIGAQSSPQEAEVYEREFSGVVFQLSPLDSPEYRIAQERVRRIMARKDMVQDLSSITVTKDDREEMAVTCDLIGRYIVRGWKGDVHDANGEKINYTPERASALLASNNDLFTWVLAQALKLSAEQQEEERDIVGKP